MDSLHLVLLEFGDVGVYEAAEDSLGRELTLHEVIALEFETVRAPLGEVVEWVRENVRVRPGFAEIVELHRPFVVSSGFHELIEPVLEREGLDVDVRANRLDARRDGWRALFRNDDPCPVCGQPCKRADLAGLGAFAYVGDVFVVSEFQRMGLGKRLMAEMASHPDLQGLRRWILADEHRREPRHHPQLPEARDPLPQLDTDLLTDGSAGDDRCAHDQVSELGRNEGGR